MNFWDKLKKPIFVLAPMADVTDSAFRRIIAKYGKPDVTWTEFVSADGLALAPLEGREKLLKGLEYSETERPIVAQFFTAIPEHMEKAARLAVELGFDGVDINMGCPDKSVEKQGSGAALIKNPKLARELIRSAKRGAPNLPISVKTRIGYNKPELEEWTRELLQEDIAVLIFHARIRKEMSKVPARWEFIKRAVEIRDEINSKTLIFGNGDVKDLSEAQERVEETGCDGVMLGRAIFGNPWLFSGQGRTLSRGEGGGQGRTLSMNTSKIHRDKGIVNPEDRLKVLLEHVRLFDKLLGGYKSFAVMKKHFKAYISGFDGAQEIRAKLMETNSLSEFEEAMLSIDFSSHL